MSRPVDSDCRAVREMLAAASAGTGERFAAERRALLAAGRRAGPLLDQVGLARALRTELEAGYARALADFEAALERRLRMRVGWRRSLRRKGPGEHESPLPWMHPFRRAAEALEAVQADWEQALARGERAEREPTRLAEVLREFGLALPLPQSEPRGAPGRARVGAGRRA